MTHLCLKLLPLNAYQTLNMAIFIKNLKGCYLWANDFFIHKSAGLCSFNEIYNKKDYDFVWHDYADELRKNDAVLFDTLAPITVYEKVSRYDRNIVSIVTQKMPLYDKEQQLMGLLGVSIALPNPVTSSLLTTREQTVLGLLAQGYTDKQAAKKLAISPRTIEAHINHAKQKYNVKTRMELIAQFFRFYP